MRAWALVSLVAVGCADGGDGSPTDSTSEPAEPQPVLLSIDLDPDLVPTMGEPAVGVFRGSVFAEADASSFGPEDGAESLEDFTTESLDFGTAGGLLETATTIGPLEPQVVWILGCFDTAGDDCESGDPITIPNENKVEITTDTTAYTLTLSLLQP